MRIIKNPAKDGQPTVLILNPNSIHSFTETMQKELKSDICNLEFYTAPDSVPHGLNGSADCVISAGICLGEIQDKLDRWDAIVIACFSAHPLVPALRELTSSPIISILEAPLLLASSIGGRVGIITTGRRWELLLEHEVHSIGMSNLNLAGVISSGFSTSELHDLPPDEVKKVLGEISRDVLVKQRNADVIVLGCAGMAGLEVAITEKCGEGIVVIDPVKAGLELAQTLLRLGVKTSKKGMYGAV